MADRVPLTGLPLLAHKLRSGGLSWAWERFCEEVRLPRTGTGQALFRAARTVARVFGGRSQLRDAAASPDILYAFYDLGVAPVTFDFLWFLASAELERRRRALTGVQVIIVPGPRAGLRKETPELEEAIDPVARRARIVSLLVPACACLPSLAGVAVASSRSEADRWVRSAGDAVFPVRYEPALPSYAGPQQPLRAAREQGTQVAVLRAPAADLRSVEAWLAAHRCDQRIVTITLRGYGYLPARNSNVAAWSAFARRLNPAEFSVVIVPDTAHCFAGIPDELQGMPAFREAAVLPGLRMALYERAYLNLGVNNGPMGLCWLNERARYITFKILNEAAAQTSPEYMQFLGFEIGQSLPFATPWQQWVWAEDELDTIESAFAAMVSRIESEAVPDSRGLDPIESPQDSGGRSYSAMIANCAPPPVPQGRSAAR
jgi:hypothetical protein